MKERTAAKRQPRPVYYTRDQLDEQCEQIIVGFCMARYGQELNPIPTEALLHLLEEYTHEVDQTADLPDGINGVTEYYWDRKPTVRLTRQHWRETGRRTTLCTRPPAECPGPWSGSPTLGLRRSISSWRSASFSFGPRAPSVLCAELTPLPTPPPQCSNPRRPPDG